MSYTRSFLAGVCKGAFLGACFVAGFGYGTILARGVDALATALGGG